MINQRTTQLIQTLPLIALEDMTPSQFRRAYGVPVHSLTDARETLAMEREALREVYGDTWRDSFAEIADEYNEDASEEDGDAWSMEGEKESLSLVRGFSALLTFGDFDGEVED